MCACIGKDSNIKAQNDLATDALVVDRRALLGFGLSSLATIGLHSINTDQGALAFQDDGIYKYRDLEKCYSVWPKQTPIGEAPPFQQYRDAIELCRRATCLVSYMRGGFSRSIHAGFLVTIPEQFQTESSRGKRYVATCEHGRHVNDGASICLLIQNGESVSPRREFSPPKEQNGFPGQDIKVLECDSGQFGDLPALPLAELPFALPLNAPAIIYEPLDCSVDIANGAKPGTLARYVGAGSAPVQEKFVLTYVSAGEHRAKSFETLSQNRGFQTGGQLFSGGSGSPVLVYLDGEFRVAGHQVSYSPEPPSDDFVNGELRCDGFAIHVNGLIELLKQKDCWKK